MKYDDLRSVSNTGTCIASALMLTAACATVPKIAPEARARAAIRPPVAAGEVSVRWLGCAAFEIRTAKGVLILDPYLSRPSTGAAAIGRLSSDEELLRELVPEASLVLAGHSHFDHLLDGPAIASRTGAELWGTPTTCFAARALMLPEGQCHTVVPGERFTRGDFAMTALLSEHSKVTGIGIPFPGLLDRVPTWRWPHMSDMPMGGAIVWVIRTEGVTLVHIGTAGLPPDPGALARAVPEGADVVLTAIGARGNTPGYTRTLISELHPRVLVPSHFDSMFGPAGAPLDEDALEDLAAFEKEAAGARVERPVAFEARTWSRAALDALPPGAIPDAAGAVKAP